MVRLVPCLSVLVATDSAQQSAAYGPQAWKDHVAEYSAAAGSEESVDAAALFALHVPAPRFAVAVAAATPAAAAVSSLVVFVVVAAVVLVFAATVNRLVLVAGRRIF